MYNKNKKNSADNIPEGIPPVDSIWEDVLRIRTEAPLVHNITNYVVMNTTANALLALGASPVMAHAVEEVEAMVDLAGALVLNIGTLSPMWVDAMVHAGCRARERGIPIVFDPVGSGATPYRTATARRILEEARPTVIRGNASEIRSLAGTDMSTKGVDSLHTPEQSLKEIAALSREWGCAVSVSGPVDIIVAGDTVISVANGHPLMSRVTGSGCTATAITGAFLAVRSSAVLAAAHAMVTVGVAGELAAQRADGPGTFFPYFLDALYKLDRSHLESHARLEISKMREENP